MKQGIRAQLEVRFSALQVQLGSGVHEHIWGVIQRMDTEASLALQGLHGDAPVPGLAGIDVCASAVCSRWIRAAQ